MTLEEYNKEKERLYSKIKGHKDELESLKRKYIQENTPFKIGEKVTVRQYKNGKVSYENDFFISDYDIEYGHIQPVFSKVKKDGKMSSIIFHQYYLDYYDCITVITNGINTVKYDITFGIGEEIKDNNIK